uniref:Glycosyltransferase family 92 protein n=1 Tax=Panagrolaimus superbus TaxID=310955 RepID=A0A914YCA6_9BILA
MLISGKSQIVRGNLMRLIYGPRQCLLTTYRMVCPFQIADVNDETVKFEIGTSSIGNQKIKFHEFSLTKPDTQPRAFVSCMSRMIAFENWALFLVQIETFRYYGGSLMVAYVECGIKKVYELMKIYENDGILKIKKAYKASEIPNIPYDPDTQTEYANQMTNSHMCLYEFKESAEFIAFADWDDILVGPNFGQQQIAFAESFRKLSVAYPFAAAFSIPRFPFVNKNAFRPKRNKFSLKQLFTQLHFSINPVPPKMVVRPEYVAGVWIHRLIYAESEKYQQINVASEMAALLHLKNLILDEWETEVNFNEVIYPKNGSLLIDGKVLQQNMENMFEKYNFTFDPFLYSHSQIFNKLIYKCYAPIEKAAQDDSLMICPTHKACIYPEQNVTVIKVKTTHKSSKTIGGLIWHERENVNFVESKEGCL